MENHEKVATEISKMVIASGKLISSGLAKSFSTVFEIDGKVYTLALIENNKVRSGELTEIKN